MRTPRPAARTMALVGLTDIFWEIHEPLFLEALGSADRITAIGAPSIADAITLRDDGHATSIMLARSDFGVLRIAPCLFLLVAGPEEIDADLLAVDPG